MEGKKCQESEGKIGRSLGAFKGHTEENGPFSPGKIARLKEWEPDHGVLQKKVGGDFKVPNS
jgi:hypothetical protein